MKRILILFLTIGFIILVSITYFYISTFTPLLYNYKNRTDFNAAKWKSWERTVEEPSMRWNMIHDLESKYEFEGMTRYKLIKLLGKPDCDSKIEIRYFLGMSGYGIDTGSLVFEIKNEKVINFSVLHG